jgi:hypothetical protein
VSGTELLTWLYGVLPGWFLIEFALASLLVRWSVARARARGRRGE